MGGQDADAFPADGEGPIRPVHVDAYRIDTKAVTTARFAAFVKGTGYVTDAEHVGWSFVFHTLVDPNDGPAILPGGADGAPWWRGVHGADWRHPDGPSSDLPRRRNHPVVHVSWNDANALRGLGAQTAAHRGGVGGWWSATAPRISAPVPARRSP